MLSLGSQKANLKIKRQFPGGSVGVQHFSYNLLYRTYFSVFVCSGASCFFATPVADESYRLQKPLLKNKNNYNAVRSSKHGGVVRSALGHKMDPSECFMNGIGLTCWILAQLVAAISISLISDGLSKVILDSV